MVGPDHDPPVPGPVEDRDRTGRGRRPCPRTAPGRRRRRFRRCHRYRGSSGRPAYGPIAHCRSWLSETAFNSPASMFGTQDRRCSILPVGYGDVPAADLRPELAVLGEHDQVRAARGRSEAMPTGVLLGSEARANRVDTFRAGWSSRATQALRQVDPQRIHKEDGRFAEVARLDEFAPEPRVGDHVRGSCRRTEPRPRTRRRTGPPAALPRPSRLRRRACRAAIRCRADIDRTATRGRDEDRRAATIPAPDRRSGRRASSASGA